MVDATDPSADPPQTWEALLARADRVRFRMACATLMDEELARAFGEALLTYALPAEPRLALLLRLFQELPMYAVLDCALTLIPELDPPGRAPLYAALAQSLARERSAASDAAETALFANLFADGSLVDETWAALATPDAPAAQLRAVLRVSAQVPWRLKRTLFARLLPEPLWHPHLFLALSGARHGMFGATIDVEEAWLLAERLVLPGREGELEALRRKLGQAAP